MKTQTRILHDRLCYTRKIELHRKGKKSRTGSDNTDIDLPLWQRNLSVLITVRRVHYGEMGKAPTSVSWGPAALTVTKVFLILYESQLSFDRIKSISNSVSHLFFFSCIGKSQFSMNLSLS